MPRTKDFNEEEALLKALNLFWTKGYEATSLSDLTTHLGIGKGSFYDTFGSKKKLLNRSLEVYRSQAYTLLMAALNAKEDRIEGIKNLIALHTETMLSSNASKGCFVANSTAELASDETVSAVLKDHNTNMKAGIVAYLKASNITTDSAALADLILSHLSGISLLSKIITDPKRFKAANTAFIKAVAAIG